MVDTNRDCCLLCLLFFRIMFLSQGFPLSSYVCIVSYFVHFHFPDRHLNFPNVSPIFWNRETMDKTQKHVIFQNFNIFKNIWPKGSWLQNALTKTLVVGLEHDFYFSINIGNVIIPIDFHIFQMARSITNQNTSGFNVPGDSQPARRNGARRNGRARSKSRSGNGHRNGWLWLGKRWVGENAKFYLIFESFGEEVYMYVCIYIYIVIDITKVAVQLLITILCNANAKAQPLFSPTLLHHEIKQDSPSS